MVHLIILFMYASLAFSQQTYAQGITKQALTSSSIGNQSYTSLTTD